jgi:hypothetical protein
MLRREISGLRVTVSKVMKKELMSKGKSWSI